MSDNPFADLDEEFDGDGDRERTEEESDGRTPEPDTTTSDDDSVADTLASVDEPPVERASGEETEETDSSPSATDADEASTTTDDRGTQRTVDPTTTEAFDYSPEMQQAVYPRPETWDDFEDAMELDMERVFRTYDVRNMSKREIHDALFGFVVDNADEIAERALRARGIEVDGDDEDDD
ncbi:hypothetical protein [Halomarina rubra]|uniref:Uncharacterized protein n=1 Tax=Halomarina rubra TaxID=2071873 RepID=A0ABD6AY48_9EURY|nr:hypothetical protein [Halomarina rubra]